MTGRLYLIPVHLGSDDFSMVIPEGVINITKKLRYFIVEELRSSRRYLRLIDNSFPINDTTFFVLNEHTSENETGLFLDPLLDGHDIGIMSEAGLPCLADPGSKIVSMAHKKGVKVIPLSGPSSIIMALIASGLNGQNFTFNGYLPVKSPERAAIIREIELRAKNGYAQIFMETPYRNQKLFETLIELCKGETKLSIATGLTLPYETVKTKNIFGWKKEKPDLNDKPTVFILQ